MPDSYNISVTQGSSFEVSITARDSTGAPINLSGFDLSGLVKTKYSDTGFILDLAPSGVSPLSSGIINIYLTRSQTENLPTCRAFYDIEIASGDYCLKILNGYFDISPEVTN